MSESMKVCGIPIEIITEFAKEVAAKDVGFILPEFKKVFKENDELRKENRILKLKLEALSGTEAKEQT